MPDGGCSPQPENSNATRFRRFANESDIAAMNTCIQNASEWTWVGSRGHKSRIDYILGKAEHKDCFVDGRVDRQIVLAECERDDHFLLFLDVDLPRDTRSDGGADMHRPRRNSFRKLCAQKLRDPGLHEDFCTLMDAYMEPEGDNINEHVEALQEHLREGRKLFEKDRDREPKKHWLPDASWELNQVVTIITGG